MVTSLNSNINFHTVDIEGMTCASCVSRIEQALEKIPDIEKASVNLATEQARIRIRVGSSLSIEEVIKAIQKTGYDAHPHSALQSLNRTNSPTWNADGRISVILSFLFSAPLIAPMLLMPFGIHWSLNGWWQLLLATPVQFILGWRFYRAGYKALLSGTGNMDLLIAIGTSAAYGLSLYLLLTNPSSHIQEFYFEGAAVIISMVLLGKWLEARAKKQTSEAIRVLQKLWPQEAKVLDANQAVDSFQSAHYQTIPIEELLPGDRVIVFPGERIPVDGVILSGTSHVDESLLTGESNPIKKVVQSNVIGGSMNGDGVLLIEAQAVGIDSVLSKIILLVEEAQTQKAPIQKLVDQISAYFVPAILVIAVITGIANWLFLDSIATAILRSVSVLVIACPCALGLATPAAIMAGTGMAARFGILIKDPQVLELAHRINVVAFDKTGTLTIGEPRLLEIIPLSNQMEIAQILAAAAGLQLGSEHPLAKAVINDANTKGISPTSVTDSKAITGIGIEAKMMDGLWKDHVLVLQSIESLRSETAFEGIKNQVNSILTTGHTVSVLRIKDSSTFIAAFLFGDEIKKNAKAVISALHQLHVKTAMISGDHLAAATVVGKSIGIDEIYAPVMPGNKAKIIQDLKSSANDQNRHWVAMVGDGINDAPALASADVGMAMATGTDVAIQSAGITLMHGDLALVPSALDISKRTWNKIQQNLFWAFIFNTAGIPLAATGYLSPMIAGSAMALSSIFVLSNALLLKSWSPNQKAKLT
jgi:P-type Cu+ transporter